MNTQFTCSILKDINKSGKLVPDSEGYYDIVLGGLNAYNNRGSYYPYKDASTDYSAEKIFSNSSDFMRRVSSGKLYAEQGHPKRKPGETFNSFLERIFSIDEKNICAHIKKVWLDMDYGKNNPSQGNKSLIAIMGKITPSGPNSESFKKSLDNPSENVSFSIRAVTDDYYDKGTKVRLLNSIITFDRVTEGGISIADKYSTPAMEGFQDVNLEVKAIEDVLTNKDMSITTEDSEAILHEVLEDLKLNKIKNQGPKIPLSFKWR